ncbi:unnamed protein product, partial [Laminaria digitata]
SREQQFFLLAAATGENSSSASANASMGGPAPATTKGDPRAPQPTSALLQGTRGRVIANSSSSGGGDGLQQASIAVPAVAAAAAAVETGPLARPAHPGANTRARSHAPGPGGLPPPVLGPPPSMGVDSRFAGGVAGVGGGGGGGGNGGVVLLETRSALQQTHRKRPLSPRALLPSPVERTPG